MLTIRLQRTGRRREPTFRLVVTDKRNGPKSGRFLDVVGSYDPRKDKKESAQLKADKIKKWIENGAQTSNTVFNILLDAGLVEGSKLNVLPKKSPIKKEEENKEAPEAEKESADAEKEDKPEEVTEEKKEEEKPKEPAELKEEPKKEE